MMPVSLSCTVAHTRPRRREASAALAVLGYSQGEINIALKGIDMDNQLLEQIIRQALKKMVKA